MGFFLKSMVLHKILQTVQTASFVLLFVHCFADCFPMIANVNLHIPVIDTWDCGINGLNRSTTIRDTVHPTDKGNKMIARYIVNAIKNGSPL